MGICSFLMESVGGRRRLYESVGAAVVSRSIVVYMSQLVSVVSVEVVSRCVCWSVGSYRSL